jgi:hypothetical protein
MPPEVGDVVSYSVHGKTYNALVLHAHAGQVDYLGKDGQPLVHLAFLAPDRESPIARSRPGYIPQVFVEYDVVHASHEFSDEFKRANALQTEAQIATKRGMGEWKEIDPPRGDWGHIREVGPDLMPLTTPVLSEAAPPAPALHDVPAPAKKKSSPRLSDFDDQEN